MVHVEKWLFSKYTLKFNVGLQLGIRQTGNARIGLLPLVNLVSN